MSTDRSPRVWRAGRLRARVDATAGRTAGSVRAGREPAAARADAGGAAPDQRLRVRDAGALRLRALAVAPDRRREERYRPARERTEAGGPRLMPTAAHL